MKIRWYGTDLPFINGESVINSRDWDTHPYLERPLGEVPTWSDRRAYNGLWEKPAGLFGRHVCSEEWFATGQPWPVTGDPVEYDTDWIPTCCGRLPPGDPTAGGIQIGGSVGDQGTSHSPTDGGVELGGSVGDQLANVDPTEGGVELGGSVGDQLANVDPTEGGVGLGGSVGDQGTSHSPTEGGLELGGEAGDETSEPAPPPGNDCTTAPLIEMNTWYSWHVTPDLANGRVWRWLAPPGVYNIKLIGDFFPYFPSIVIIFEIACVYQGNSAALEPGHFTIISNGTGMDFSINTYGGPPFDLLFRLSPGPAL